MFGNKPSHIATLKKPKYAGLKLYNQFLKDIIGEVSYKKFKARLISKTMYSFDEL